MADSCLQCAFFDPDDTALPVCVLLDKYVEEEWRCGDFEPYREEQEDEGWAVPRR